MMASSSSEGSDASRVLGATGVSRICLRATTIGVSPVKAGLPVKIS